MSKSDVFSGQCTGKHKSEKTLNLVFLMLDETQGIAFVKFFPIINYVAMLKVSHLERKHTLRASYISVTIKNTSRGNTDLFHVIS